MGTFDRFFKGRQIDDFARSLASDVAKRYPPVLDQQEGKRPSVNRLTRIVEDACAKAREFRTTHQLGWIGKAKLGNAFRWQLLELGYRKDFVEFATEAIVVEMSRAKAPPK